ncbi:MAG: hypothetical protein KGL36_13690 [Gammaproteobacteria bacterium]|nr:hypothetical protein [Gammaproteobacteria bacterium]
MRTRTLARYVPTFALAVMTSSVAARAATPVLAPGEWHYQSQVTYRSGMMNGRSMHSEWKVCVKPSDTQPPMPVPHTPGVHCDPPTLVVAAGAWHTSLSCTAESHGLVTKMVDRFVITPSADKRKVMIDGTVHQSFSGSPVALPASVMSLHTTGERVGPCGAAK